MIKKRLRTKADDSEKGSTTLLQNMPTIYVTEKDDL